MMIGVVPSCFKVTIFLNMYDSSCIYFFFLCRSLYYDLLVFDFLFKKKEKMGRIRHLRVTNYGDVVPKVPQLSLDFFPIKYCHVGIHLQLYDNTTIRFSYPVDGKSALIDVTENIIVPLTHSQILYLHGCDTYHSRISNAKGQLQEAYLDDMYSSKEFIGSYSNV